MVLKKPALCSAVSEKVKEANGDQGGFGICWKNQRLSESFQKRFKKPSMITAASELFSKETRVSAFLGWVLEYQRCFRMNLIKPALISAVPKEIQKPALISAVLELVHKSSVYQRWLRRGLRKPTLIQNAFKTTSPDHRSVRTGLKKTRSHQRCLRMGSKNQRISALFQNGSQKNQRWSILSKNGFQKTSPDDHCVRLIWKT